MPLTQSTCREAMRAKDARYDGWVFCGVLSTGIYCCPTCPAPAPKAENVRFFDSAAAAQAAGLRACKRCRPDVRPGNPEWDRRADLVGRAMRLIADGVVDREGVPGLADRLGYSERHLNRELTVGVGASPLALARAQRAQAARVLIETTALAMTDVAHAAGFASVRQFNATVREVFALRPRELRARAAREHRTEDGGTAIVVRLPHRRPLDAAALIGYLGRRAVPGVEEVDGDVYRRSLRLPYGAGLVDLRAGDGHFEAAFRLDDPRDLAAAVRRCRVLLDLDADPVAVDEALGGDPTLGPLVARSPGRRVPGQVDEHELALRAVLGQQISLSGAATLAGRLVAARGEPLEHPRGAVTHLFPSAGALRDLRTERLAMPRARARALTGLARALDDGDVTLDPGADRERAVRELLELPGIGPWTASYVAMRALRDPDAFMPSDLGVHHALERLGLDPDPRCAERAAEAWSPYRAYATQHLWASLDAPRRETDAVAA